METFSTEDTVKCFSFQFFFQFFRLFSCQRYGSFRSFYPASSNGYLPPSEKCRNIPSGTNSRISCSRCRDHGQRRCLDTAAGKLCVVFAGEGPGGVDAHQPVGLSPGCCRPVKIFIFPAVPKIAQNPPESLYPSRKRSTDVSPVYGSLPFPESSGPPALLLFRHPWR